MLHMKHTCAPNQIVFALQTRKYGLFRSFLIEEQVVQARLAKWKIEIGSSEWIKCITYYLTGY